LDFVFRFRWNHPAIVALNPSATLTNKPITVALHGDSFNLMGQFTNILGVTNPAFAQAVPASTQPKWPFSKYAQYKLEVDIDGPTGYVAATPYSISIAFVSIADRFQVRCASVINPYGNAVLPTYHTIASGFDERVISSQRSTSGADVITYNSDLTPGNGPNAWPFLFAVTLIINRDFSAQSCVLRSELVKWIRWMRRTADIKYNLAISEATAMISDDTNARFHVEETIATLTCQGEPVSNGDRKPIMLGGVMIVHHHFNLHEIWMLEFTRLDELADYAYMPMDEGEALINLLKVDSDPDVLFFCPTTAKLMYSAQYSSVVASAQAQTMHAGIFAVVLNYELPLVAAARSGTDQLVIDIETAALVFLGDITEWTDARLTARNPHLISAFVGEDTSITVIFCGRGILADAPLTPAGNHLAIALNRTNAFRGAGITMTLPVDWTEVVARRDAKGAKYFELPNERSMEAATDRIAGAFGYLISSGDANDVDQFRMVRRVHEADGTYSESIVLPTAKSLVALANNTQPTNDIDWVEDNAISESPLFRDAWPIPMALSIAVSTSVSTGRSIGLSAESICFRQQRAVRYAEWMTTSEDVGVASDKAGRGAVSSLPQWQAYFQTQLKRCTCQGEPILYVAPVTWEMPVGVSDFSKTMAAIGLLLVAATIVLIVLFRHRSIVKLANLPLQLTSLAGMVLLFAAAGVYSNAPTSASCSGLGWLVSLGAACMFFPLCAKIFRVYHLSSQQKKRSIRTRKISNRVLLIEAAVWFAVHMIVLGIAQSKAGGVLTPETVTQFDGTREHIYTQCSMVKSNAYSYITIGLHAALLFVTVLVSFGLMRISSPFSESRHITWSLWNSMLTVLIVIPILIVSGGMQSDTGSFLIVFLLIWVTLTTLAFTFGYKLYHLMSEEWQVFMTMRQESSLRGSAASGVSGVSSHMSKSSRSSEGSSTGLIGTDKHFDVEAALQLPSLMGASIVVLEKYITVLETHIRMARAKRQIVFGNPCPVPIGGYATIQLHAIDENDQVVQLQSSSQAASATTSARIGVMRPRAPKPLARKTSVEMASPATSLRIDVPDDGHASGIAPAPRASSPLPPVFPPLSPERLADRPAHRRKISLGGPPLSSGAGRAPMRIQTMRSAHSRALHSSPEPSAPAQTGTEEK
jgi:hypothetical protein